MIKLEKTQEVESNYSGLNKILFGTLKEVKRKEIDIEMAATVSQIADKIIKNNLTAILDKKRRNDDSAIEFFDTAESQILLTSKKDISK